MASVNFSGPYTYGSTSGVWHTKATNVRGVVMSASGTLNATRNGSTITGSVTNAISKLVNSGSSFGYYTWVYVYAHTSEKSWQVGRLQVEQYLSGKGDYWNKSFNFSFETNSEVTLTVVYHCADSNNESGSCHQYYNGQNFAYVTMNGSITLESYNPYTPPTAPTYCVVNCTRVKPDGTLLVTWDGEDGGTNQFSKFELQMNVWRNGSLIYNNKDILGPLYYSNVGYHPSTVSVQMSTLKLRPRRCDSVSSSWVRS